MSVPEGFLGINAAADLAGKTLPEGWSVIKRVDRLLTDTGGNFSINYWVEDAGGRQAFCKVINFHWLLSAADFGLDPIDAMQRALAIYQFERDLARECSRMPHVVTAIADGSVTFPGYAQPLVSYIIFERADQDIRRLLDTSERLDIAVRFRSLHNLACGLMQLHSKGIAHQDVKPSNTLVFHADAAGNRETKIGDLGRATVSGRPMPHDEYFVAGDPTYGPPEGLYRSVPDGFGPRRIACDLYQLGSMVCFMFTRLPFTAILKDELHPAHTWDNWAGSFEQVLPYVRDAHGRALERVRNETPTEVQDAVTRLVEYLCDPDPAVRGHPLNRQRMGNQYSLERVVTELDRLVHLAIVKLRTVE